MTTAIAPFEPPQCCPNGTVAYWCPRRGHMVRGATTSIPKDAQALMTDADLARVKRHVWRHWSVYL